MEENTYFVKLTHDERVRRIVWGTVIGVVTSMLALASIDTVVSGLVGRDKEEGFISVEKSNVH